MNIKATNTIISYKICNRVFRIKDVFYSFFNFRSIIFICTYIAGNLMLNSTS